LLEVFMKLLGFWVFKFAIPTLPMSIVSGWTMRGLKQNAKGVGHGKISL